MKKRTIDRPILWVFIVSLITLFPVLAFRDYTPSNELRYLNIVDEAIAQGKLFAFTCNGEIYADKPPFYFWLMMLCRIIFGRHCIFVLSLLSFIPAFITVSVMDKWLRSSAQTDCITRLATSLMLITSVLFLGMSVIVRMDMLMIMWIVLSLWTFWKMDHNGSRLQSWLLPFYIFMGLFTKGPVGLLMPVVSISAYLIVSKRARDFGRFLGFKTWGVLVLLSAAWLYGAWVDGGAPYVRNLLFHQTIDRAVNAFNHKQPFWYYGKEIWGIIAPWCLTLVPSLILSLCTWRDKATELEKFFGVSAASCIVMLSLFSSKLAVYLGPMIPFTVYLLPLFIKRIGWHKWMKITLSISFFVLLTGGMAPILARTVSFTKYPFICSNPLLLAGLLLSAGSIYAILLIRNNDWKKPVISAASSILVALLVASLSMNSINDFVGYRNLCALVPENSQVYTFRVKRAENMNVYLGREVKDFGEDAKSFIESAPKQGVLLIKNSALKDYPELSDYLNGMKSSLCGKYSAYFLMERVSESDCGSE